VDELKEEKRRGSGWLLTSIKPGDLVLNKAQIATPGKVVKLAWPLI